MSYLKCILLLLAFNPLNSVACDCDWGGDFFNVGLKEDLIIKGKVLEFSTLNFGFNVQMTVEIIENFKGIENRKTITVWGDRGYDCRPYLSLFKQGTEYFMALHKLNENEYEIFNCGEYYLSIHNGFVESEIAIQKEYPHTERIKVKRFKNILKRKLNNAR